MLRSRAAERRQAPALAVQRTADEIEPAHPQIRQHGAHLRQIADGAVAALRRAAEHAHVPGARRQQAEYGAHQRGLAGAVGPEHADEFAGPDGKAGVGEHRATADPDGCVVEFDDTHEDGPASAFSASPSSPSIQSW